MSFRVALALALATTGCGGLLGGAPVDGGSTLDSPSDALGAGDVGSTVGDGGCQPFPADAAPYLTSDAGVVTILACPPNNRLSSAALVADDSNVYWLDSPYQYGTSPPPGAVYECAVQGCGLNPTLLADHQSNPGALAVDSTTVYWTNQGDYENGVPGTIAKCAISGCAKPSVVYTNGTQIPRSIAVDSSGIYFTTSLDGPTPQPGDVMKCGLDGSSPTVLATGESSPRALVTDATNAYWADDDDRVRVCALGGCGGNPATLVTSATHPINLVADGAYIYWTGEYGNIERCAVSGCGAPTVIASSTGEPYGLAIANDIVDWTNVLGQTIVECSASTCNDNPVELIRGQFNPTGLVRRGKRIYWTDEGIGYVLALTLD